MRRHGSGSRRRISPVSLAVSPGPPSLGYILPSGSRRIGFEIIAFNFSPCLRPLSCFGFGVSANTRRLRGRTRVVCERARRHHPQLQRVLLSRQCARGPGPGSGPVRRVAVPLPGRPPDLTPASRANGCGLGRGCRSAVGLRFQPGPIDGAACLRRSEGYTFHAQSMGYEMPRHSSDRFGPITGNS